jgi:ribonuclease D
MANMCFRFCPDGDNGHVSASTPSFDRVFADSGQALESAVARLGGLDAIGVDVEMGQKLHRLPGGVTKGEQILALIQIAGGGFSLICDPRTITDLSPLAALFSSETVKVFLGGATDIQLLEGRGLPVHHVVDLAEVAVSVFGHKEEGMRALADRALGIQIDKSIRREDWMRRPIPAAMLSYAYQDAELTIQLYRWFLKHHKTAVKDHARKHFHPALSEEIAEWVRKFLTSRQDVHRMLKEMKIDPVAKSAQLARDVKLAESHSLSPGQQRRLLRLIADLKLTALYDDVLPYASSRSVMFRSSAARTLGKLGDKRALPVLKKLAKDPIGDVQTAAESAINELTPAKKVKAAKDAEGEQAELKPAAMRALKRIRSALTPGSDKPR